MLEELNQTAADEPVIGPSNGFSFVKNTASMEHAIHNELLPRLFTNVQNCLSSFDKAVTDAERVVAHGEELLVKKDRFNVSPTQLEAVCGEEAWEEMKKLAKEGRAFLKSMGFETRIKGKPAVLVQAEGNTSAAAMVEERSAGGLHGGDMPLKSLKITPVTTGRRTPLTAPDTK